VTETNNPLLEAVDKLTKPRKISTVIKDDLTGAWLDVHTEEHPPLLQLLNEGTGAGRGSKTSDIRIPIDADALELEQQIFDLTKLWCKQLGASFIGDDLPSSVRHWYLAHTNAVQSGKVREMIDRDVTRMVESWVRMIEFKFEPEEKREWTDACPAWVETPDPDGGLSTYSRCGARRIRTDTEERFAIQLNVTTMTAECSECRTVWQGLEGVKELRYDTNVWNLQKADEAAKRMAELERLAAGVGQAAESAA
jgi:hypothetical protein